MGLEVTGKENKRKKKDGDRRKTDRISSQDYSSLFQSLELVKRGENGKGL